MLPPFHSHILITDEHQISEVRKILYELLDNPLDRSQVQYFSLFKGDVDENGFVHEIMQFGIGNIKYVVTYDIDLSSARTDDNPKNIQIFTV